MRGPTVMGRGPGPAMPGDPRPPGEALWRRLAEAQNVALATEELARLDAPVAERDRAAVGAPSAERVARRARPLRMTAAVAAVAVAAAALFLLIPRRPPGRLRVQVGSAAETMAAVPSLVADARADLPLRFSDGSAVVFRAGSAGRLESLTASGSELVLEHGTLTAHVVHASATAWVVHAGPYRVRITGTRFAVSWRAGRLDLSLFEGSVIVDGSILGVGVPLTAGRRLTVASGVVRIEPFQAEGGPLPRVAQRAARGDGAPEGADQADLASGVADRRSNEAQAVGSGPAEGRGSDGMATPSARSTDSGERAPGGVAPSGDEARSDGRGSHPAPARAGGMPTGSTAIALADGPRGSDALARFAGQGVAGSQEDLMMDEPTASARAAEDAATPTRRRHTRAPRSGAGGARSGEESWLALAEDRHYPEALAAARRLGWSNLCRRLDAHRLLTLADVARYSGARAPARRAFESLARRFPHDRLAGDAVFSLGRMAFEAGHAAEAARWFKRYGADWPNGPLADEAAGRLVESAIRLQDAEAAHAAAHAYLARAPHGPQASLARGVLADSPDGAP